MESDTPPQAPFRSLKGESSCGERKLQANRSVILAEMHVA